MRAIAAGVRRRLRKTRVKSPFVGVGDRRKTIVSSLAR
jgi:hypothetical protein